MSNDMKCPICQSNLHKINIVVSTCTNDKCKLWGSSIPNLVLKALTQTKQDLERTRKELEQSETCCTEWEKQALDYKAENIALSGELERTRKALYLAIEMLKDIKNDPDTNDELTQEIADRLSEVETALEQKEQQCQI